MDSIRYVIDLFLHIDRHLEELFKHYGAWVYGILALTIFVETGLVIWPFLPGDSLLFAAGALAGRGALRHEWLFFLLTACAIIGDNVNYWIGKFFGPRLARRVKQAHLDRTHAFFEKYGGKTIIMARFVPIVRTFAPFVAGIGAMTYRRFLAYDIVGGILWVGICVYAGYFFGRHPIVKENFSIVVAGVVFISILPGLIGYARYRLARRAQRELNP